MRQNCSAPALAEDGDVIHGDHALGQQFLHITVGQAVPQLPADLDRDDLGREPEASRLKPSPKMSLHQSPARRDRPMQQCHREFRGCSSMPSMYAVALPIV